MSETSFDLIRPYFFGLLTFMLAFCFDEGPDTRAQTSNSEPKTNDFLLCV